MSKESHWSWVDAPSQMFFLEVLTCLFNKNTLWLQWDSTKGWRPNEDIFYEKLTVIHQSSSVLLHFMSMNVWTVHWFLKVEYSFFHLQISAQSFKFHSRRIQKRRLQFAALILTLQEKEDLILSNIKLLDLSLEESWASTRRANRRSAPSSPSDWERVWPKAQISQQLSGIRQSQKNANSNNLKGATDSQSVRLSRHSGRRMEADTCTALKVNEFTKAKMLSAKFGIVK